MNATARNVLSTLALIAVAGLAACNNCGTCSDSDAPAAAVPAEAKLNTTCPFTGGKANPSFTSTHAGQSVAFCCAGCRGKFEGMSAEKKDAMMKKAQ